ncbi:MAG: long-chain fatty acid--CoA ligase [Deltaproteobacteria bacterium]|nr:MAG: long-chain fatty acid--CoA ligase [Deltaproteobacteria bacterium]
MQEPTLSQMFLNRLDAGGDKVKFRFKRDGQWKDMTYAQAAKVVRALSAGLYSLGLERGDKVCILSTTRVEWTLVDIANIIGGFITVPIYHSLLPDQVQYIIDHCGAKAVFVEDEMQLMKIEVIREHVPKLEHVIAMTPIPQERLESAGGISFNELQKRGEAFLSEKPGFIDDIAMNQIKPEDDLTVIYTSGTTGPPKGVLTTHAHYQFIVTACIQTQDLYEGEVILHFLPFAHSLGRVEQFIALDVNLLQAYAENINTVPEDMVEIKPHIMFSVPRLYEKFYDRVMSMVAQAPPLKKKIFDFALRTGRDVSRLKQKKKEVPFFLNLKYSLAKKLVFDKVKERVGGRLRFFISGGAPLAREIAEFFHAMDILILEGYGLTECSTVATVNRYNHFKFGTVGPPVPGVKIKIAEDGEILIGGKNVMKEYLNDPEATKQVITEDGWLKSGDIGYLDEEGFLTITDRKKDIIVTAGGKNIPPANIENMLKTEKFISQAFLYGDRKKYLTALITLDRAEVEEWAKEKGISYPSFEELASSREVRELIQERVDAVNSRLASFETIKKFVILPQDFSIESGELTPTLKVKRKVVVAKFGHLLEKLYEE